MQKQVHNFSAGPCVLPKAVLLKAQAELMDWHGTGLSVMEMSHRGKPFQEIAETAKANLRKLLEIPEDYTIFFFQGGASQQFSAICQNLLGDNAEASANYLTTGTWSESAVKEAKKYCNANEVANNIKDKYAFIKPAEEWNIKQDATYFHYCDNETIQGFEFTDFPFHVIPEKQLVVCDMSSNFCSKKIDWSKYDVVYAGA